MNRLRTHIARTTIIVLVWTGFSLYIVQPVQAKQSPQAFASWFSKMVKSPDGIELKKQLDNLQKNGGHLDRIIKKASQIVSSNNDEFDFSFAKRIASKHLYQLLLIEWNQFQTGKAMSSVPSQPAVKNLAPVMLDKTGPIGSATIPTASDKVFDTDKLLLDCQQWIPVKLVPMFGSIVIGAP